MSRYRNAVDLRRALETRLKQQSEKQGTDLGRLRRRVLFDRLVTRVARAVPGRWVLKGGVALEFRLLDRARATKDIDFALRSENLDGAGLHDELIETLSQDQDQDGFVFRVGTPTPLTADASGRPAWRFGVEAHLAGRTFAGVRLDVAARPEELTATDYVPLPGALAFAGVPTGSVEAVDRRQHFAEKLHALTRDYGDRPNTRIKDLVDLILLIETGLQPGAELTHAVQHVFAIRATHAIPTRIPDLPPAWEAGYPRMAAGLTANAPDLIIATSLLGDFWIRALTHHIGTDT